jgi:hypothetical protein
MKSAPRISGRKAELGLIRCVKIIERDRKKENQ